MAKVLFVCYGNVGRSQMAEGFYNYYTKSNEGCSAGTDPDTPKKYPKLPEAVCQLMIEEGIDVSHQKVKMITKKVVEDAERIFVMCEKSLCPDFLLSSKKAEYWDIEDPYQKGMEAARKIRGKIRENVLGIV